MFEKLISKFKSKKSTSAKETIKSGSLNEITDKNAVTYRYKNTPIWVRGDTEMGYFLTLGDYRITESLQSIEECEKLIRTRDINLLIAIMSAVAISENDNKNLNKTPQETVENDSSYGIEQN